HRLRRARQWRGPRRAGGEELRARQCAGLSASAPGHLHRRDAACRHQQDRQAAARPADPNRRRIPKMKAAVVREHGGPDRLNFEANFPDPKPGEGDVIVAVKAASLNYHDVFTRRGMPGIKVPMPAIMGLDVAGEIAEVGPGVGRWKKGDRVLVDPINRVEGGLMGETVHGGLAELCRARAHQLVRIPDGVSFADAAALPVAYGTALRMMVTNGH